jgi:hypothetical protein
MPKLSRPKTRSQQRNTSVADDLRTDDGIALEAACRPLRTVVAAQRSVAQRCALVVNAIPRLCRLQNLLHLDLWLARARQGRDQPKGKGRKEFQKRKNCTLCVHCNLLFLLPSAVRLTGTVLFITCDRFSVFLRRVRR